MKTKNNVRASRLLSAAIAITPALAVAGPEIAEPVSMPAPASDSLWEFRLEPYGWLTGLDGSTTAGGITTDVDAPFFNDILDNLKMAAALQFEARYNQKWGLIVDGFYADLGARGSTPGPVYDSVSVNLKQFIGQASIAYRIHETPKYFVDVFAGARYNYMALDLGAVINPAGVQTISTNASGAFSSTVEREAEAIVEPRIAEYQSAAAAERTQIENELLASIPSDAKARVKENLERELVRIRRNNGLSPEIIITERLARNVKRETAALAEATARLKVAELRASVDSTLQRDVARAQKQVNRADKRLANALDSEITNSLPTNVSADKQWVDPIIGFRSQYNLNDRWFLAGNGDIGGFGVSSDLTWSLEATVGYNFTRKISAELGYRYLYTDFSDGGFGYDMAQAGIYTGLNIRF